MTPEEDAAFLLDVVEAKTLHDAATHGEWFEERHEKWPDVPNHQPYWELYAENLVTLPGGDEMCLHPWKLIHAKGWDGPKPADAAFIVASHRLIPRLVDYITRLNEELGDVKDLLPYLKAYKTGELDGPGLARMVDELMEPII